MSQANHSNAKVEIIASNKIIEVRYFDDPKDKLYRSWKLPKDIVKELVRWWLNLKATKDIIFPLITKNKLCEFTMYTEKYIEIKPLDFHGRPAMTGWSLSVVVVERLVIWQNGKVK